MIKCALTIGLFTSFSTLATQNELTNHENNYTADFMAIDATQDQSEIAYDETLDPRSPQYSGVWTHCGYEGNTCTITSSQEVTVRYGVPGDYFYFTTKGVPYVPCNNFFGDPKYGVRKRCSYTTTNVTYVPKYDSQFSYCASEGGSCHNYNYGERWLRYGVSGRWVYTTVSYDQKAYCSNSALGFDPIRGTRKICQMGPEVSGLHSGFSTCANEGGSCKITGNAPVLLRYGAQEYGQGQWITRFVNNGTVNCNNSLFNNDPFRGKRKKCQIKRLSYNHPLTIYK